MFIAKGLLVSGGENRTHQILNEWADHVGVFPKVRFFDVADWNTPNISPQEHRYLEQTHFDFVVTEPTRPYRPLFAVEFDGIAAAADSIDPYRNLKKSTKSRVCEDIGFPLLWIEYPEIVALGGETILDAIIESYVGGEWVKGMAERGEIHPDGAVYTYMFKPALRLLHKYPRAIFPELGVIEPQSWVIGKNVIAGFRVLVRTNRGIEEIARRVGVKAINFPHYSPIEMSIDLSLYECMKEFGRRVRSGRYTIDEERAVVYAR